MQVNLTGRKVSITRALRDHVQVKMGKLEGMFPVMRKVAVVLTVEKYRHTCEIHLHAEGVEMSAKKTTKDMYASIDAALKALEQQGAKRKERLRGQHARRKTTAKVKAKVAKKSRDLE